MNLHFKDEKVPLQPGSTLALHPWLLPQNNLQNPGRIILAIEDLKRCPHLYARAKMAIKSPFIATLYADGLPITTLHCRPLRLSSTSWELKVYCPGQELYLNLHSTRLNQLPFDALFPYLGPGNALHEAGWYNVVMDGAIRFPLMGYGNVAQNPAPPYPAYIAKMEYWQLPPAISLPWLLREAAKSLDYDLKLDLPEGHPFLSSIMPFTHASRYRFNWGTLGTVNWQEQGATTTLSQRLPLTSTFPSPPGIPDIWLYYAPASGLLRNEVTVEVQNTTGADLSILINQFYNNTDEQSPVAGQNFSHSIPAGQTLSFTHTFQHEVEPGFAAFFVIETPAGITVLNRHWIIDYPQEPSMLPIASNLPSMSLWDLLNGVMTMWNLVLQVQPFGNEISMRPYPQFDANEPTVPLNGYGASEAIVDSTFTPISYANDATDVLQTPDPEYDPTIWFGSPTYLPFAATTMRTYWLPFGSNLHQSVSLPAMGTQAMLGENPSASSITFAFRPRILRWEGLLGVGPSTIQLPVSGKDTLLGQATLPADWAIDQLPAAALFQHFMSTYTLPAQAMYLLMLLQHRPGKDEYENKTLFEFGVLSWQDQQPYFDLYNLDMETDDVEDD